MRSGFPRWMVLVLVQVGSVDQEGRAPEKDSPVAGWPIRVDTPHAIQSQRLPAKNDVCILIVDQMKGPNGLRFTCKSLRFTCNLLCN